MTNVKLASFFRTFIFFGLFVPFSFHIFSAVVPQLYNFEVIFITIPLVCISIVLGLLRPVINRSILFGLPLFLSGIFWALYFQDLQHLKVSCYLGIFYFLALNIFLEKRLIISFIQAFHYTNFALIGLFVFCIFAGEVEPYLIENLKYLSAQAPIHVSFNRHIVFYFLVFDANDVSGIFNFPRFYGFSREPGFYVMFTIPLAILSIYYNKFFCAFMFLLGTVLTSSFWGFGTLLLMSPFFIASKKTGIVVVVGLSALVFLGLDFTIFSDVLGNARANDYNKLISQIFSSYYQNLATLFTATSIKFVTDRLLLILFLGSIIVRCLKAETRLPLIFIGSSIILIYKANELLPPLLLLYLVFTSQMISELGSVRGKHRSLHATNYRNPVI